MENLEEENNDLEETFREWEKAENENLIHINKRQNETKKMWFQFLILSFLNFMSYLLKISLVNLSKPSYSIPGKPSYSIEDVD